MEFLKHTLKNGLEVVAERNGDAAVWAQGTQSFELFGAGSALLGNRYAGVVLLDPQPGERVLDACAAPGGKTCHMAERMQSCGQIIAVDSSQERLARVVENMQRLDLPIIATVPHLNAGFMLYFRWIVQ